jgi:hypothetical protein
MSNFPDNPMYAVLKNNTVVSCGFFIDNVCRSAFNPEVSFKDSDGFTFVKMTLDNSPAGINMKYNGNKFYFEGEENA